MTRTMGNPAASPRIGLRKLRGRAVRAGNVAVTPESLVLTVRLPFAAFVWQRPTAVAVEQDRRVSRVPIRDVTRLSQGALIGGVVILGLVARRRATRSREEKS